MKRMFIVVVAFLCLVLMMGAADITTPTWFDGGTSEKRCLGYTIIAFDKGVDCHGDTIQLIRRNGFAERMSTDFVPR